MGVAEAGLPTACLNSLLRDRRKEKEKCGTAITGPTGCERPTSPRAGILSMDRRGRWMDKVFIEPALAQPQARRRQAELASPQARRSTPSVYVVEGNPDTIPGVFGFCRARSVTNIPRCSRPRLDGRWRAALRRVVTRIQASYESRTSYVSQLRRYCKIDCATPVSINIGFQRALSATIKLRNSSTVNVSATSPSWRSRFATSGPSVILTIRRFTLWPMSGGNPAGPASPNQLVLTSSGYPAP
jgi:hypothetical protein